MQKPIIIAGFGRSGTTWISDIISKTLGGLILFEPDHPLVLLQSKEYLYKSTYSDLESSHLKKHLMEVMQKEILHKWLLRNHLPIEEKISEDFLEMVWHNSKILGFKTIRWNYNIEFLSKISPHIVFVIRHPLAVVSSLLDRITFFNEFGWDSHWQLFKKRSTLDKINLAQYDSADVSIKYVVLWTVSNISALQQLGKRGIPYFQYEQIYNSPYQEAKKILSYLGYEKKSIHPSSIFYPSMLSLKTFHAQRKIPKNGHQENHNFFWQKNFNNKESNNLINVVTDLARLYPQEKELFEKMGYLQTIS